jgi:hypothetical protein
MIRSIIDGRLDTSVRDGPTHRPRSRARAKSPGFPYLIITAVFANRAPLRALVCLREWKRRQSWPKRGNGGAGTRD